MKNEIVKLVSFLLKAIVLVVALDFVIGLCLTYFFNRMMGGERARVNYVINRSKDDLIIMGSSRAWNHYIPKIFEDTLGISTYNAGRSAQSLLYQSTLLEMLLEKHKPKIILLDINENDLVYDPRKYDIFKSLKPYYKTSSIFRDRFNRLNPEYRFFGWSNSLNYNSSIISILYRSLRPIMDVNKGFQALKGSSISDIEIYDNCNEQINFDSVMIEALSDFILTCKENDIKLFFTFSPRATEYSCPRKDYEAIKKLIEDFNVTSFDFVTKQKFRVNLAYMHDHAHLSAEGALEFSRDIAHLLRIELAK